MWSLFKTLTIFSLLPWSNFVNFASQHWLQVEAFAARGTFILGPKRWGALISRYLFDKRWTMERELKEVFWAMESYAYARIVLNQACMTISSAWQDKYRIPIISIESSDSRSTYIVILCNDFRNKMQGDCFEFSRHATVVQSPWLRVAVTWHFFKIPLIWWLSCFA